MKPIVADAALVAKCGLYCGACPKYLKDKCPGCAKNEKAGWCKVRSCTFEHGWASCAECTLKTANDCKEFNSFMSKLFGFIFQSNRAACIHRIQEVGIETYAGEMAKMGRPSLKR
ncbi:MAG: DUF3795 domain-containing protein [Proteobacteria bacterium]|nr:DUF3795 domain-containing protein [Pseudomonadota bacterium]